MEKESQKSNSKLIFKSHAEMVEQAKQIAMPMAKDMYMHCTEKCLLVNNQVAMIAIQIVLNKIIPNLGRKRSNRIDQLFSEAFEETSRAFKHNSDPEIARFCEQYGIDHDYFFGIKKDYGNDPMMMNDDGELVVFVEDFEKEKAKENECNQ